MTKTTGQAARRLRSELGRRAPATLDEEGAQRASVAVVVTAEADPLVLLVKRRERTGDPWSGHAAFPGGFRSAVDEDALGTAERETEEETGLHLATIGERLGRLDDVFPRSVYLPKVIVTPCVFSVPRALPVTPSHEIDRAVWVRLADLLAEENRGPLVVELPSGPREYVAIRIDDLVVWGLTERIVSQLLNILDT